MNSWAIYLLSAVALLLLVSPQLAGAVLESRESSDWRNVDGVRAAVDALRPGVMVNLTYGTAPTNDQIELRGLQLSCAYGNGTIVFPSRWPLTNANLTASAHYLIWLSDGQVEVGRTG